MDLNPHYVAEKVEPPLSFQTGVQLGGKIRNIGTKSCGIHQWGPPCVPMVVLHWNGREAKPHCIHHAAGILLEKLMTEPKQNRHWSSCLLKPEQRSLEAQWVTQRLQSLKCSWEHPRRSRGGELYEPLPLQPHGLQAKDKKLCSITENRKFHSKYGTLFITKIFLDFTEMVDAQILLSMASSTPFSLA